MRGPRYLPRALRGALVCLAAVGLCAPVAARAQGDVPPALTVFLDCRTRGCDRNFLITELPYVLFTQDRLDAEVHALITGLRTGAGGRELTIALIGQRRFAGRVDTLRAIIPPNTTDDAERRELTRVLKVGLAPFALQTGAGSRLAVTYDAPAADSSAVAVAAQRDPWNFWVFRASASGDVGAESRSEEYSLEGSLTASRITEALKVVIDADYEYEGNIFRLDSSEVQFAIRSADLDVSVVRSVSEHWSVGVGGNVGLDEFRNQDLAATLETGIEWNYFPWREATSRQLVGILAVGLRHFDYVEETIFEETAETRGVVLAQIATESRQAWGSVFGGIEHARYLHDPELYSVSVSANVDVRLTRGLSISFGGDAERVNDQLYLPRGDASDDQVLTRQRALATSFRVNAYVGVNYTFGSIFNTIVNPRFDAYR